MAPKRSAKMPSGVSKCTKAGMCLRENMRVLEKLPSGVSYVLLALSSMRMSQLHILSEVSLNRNIQNARFCINWLTKLIRGSQKPDISPKAVIPYSLIQCCGDFIEQNYHK